MKILQTTFQDSGWGKETMLRCFGAVNANEYRGFRPGTLRLTAANLDSGCPEAGTYSVILDLREEGWENLTWEEWLATRRQSGERPEGVHFYETADFPSDQ